jgi:hypothetical protein
LGPWAYRFRIEVARRDDARRLAQALREELWAGASDDLLARLADRGGLNVVLNPPDDVEDWFCAGRRLLELVQGAVELHQALAGNVALEAALVQPGSLRGCHMALDPEVPDDRDHRGLQFADPVLEPSEALIVGHG